MVIFVESGLILKRSFPGSFVVVGVSGGDQTFPRIRVFPSQKLGFFLKSILFLLFAPQAHYVQERAGYLGREIMMSGG